MAFNFTVLRRTPRFEDDPTPMTRVRLSFDPPYATGDERPGYETCAEDTWTVPLPIDEGKTRAELARLLANAGIET